MITPILEKLLLHGHAKNKIAHFGWSSFCQLEIPDNSFIVVHKFHWHPAINQKLKNITGMTWKQLFQYSESQLKVQSDKENPNFYFLRNEVDFQIFYFDPTVFDLSQNVNPDWYNKYILMRPKKPVQIDTWITSYDSLKFTLTRSALLGSAVSVNASTMGPVNNNANEKAPPTGVGGVDVLLDVQFNGNSTLTNYQPPNFNNTNIPVNGGLNAQRDYGMVYDTPDANDNGSFMNDPYGLNAHLDMSEFANNPLLSIEYCIVSKDWGTHLSGM